jgi:hypothetical protein
MFQTMKQISGLSAAERATILSGQFAGDYTAEVLIEQMRRLANFDRFNDATRGKLKGRIGLAVVLAIITVFGWFQSRYFLAPVWRPAILVVAALFVLLAVYCGVMLSRLNRLDISNNFRDVALPFLTVLKQDMEPTQAVSVRIDLRPPTHPRKRQGQPKPYQKGNYSKIVDTVYHDPWFAGTARLADDSVLRWGVTDDIVDSTRSKRSASGKTKTKRSERRRTLVAVALSVSSKRYGVGDAKGGKDRVSVVGDGKRRVIKIARKIKSKTLQPFPPDVLVDVVSAAYKRLLAPQRTAA